MEFQGYMQHPNLYPDDGGSQTLMNICTCLLLDNASYPIVAAVRRSDLMLVKFVPCQYNTEVAPYMYCDPVGL